MRAPQQLVEHVRHRRAAEPGRRSARARAGAVVRHRPRCAAHASAASRERNTEKRDRSPVSSRIDRRRAAVRRDHRQPPSLPVEAVLDLHDGAERAGVHQRDARQIEDQARVVSRDGLVELRNEIIDGIHVQLARGRDHGRLGHREGRTRNR